MRTVDLVVASLDLYDDATDELLSAQLGDFGWAERDGVTTATIYVSAGCDAVSAVCDAAHRIESVTDAKVTHVDEDLVAVSDMAQRTGLHRETVRLLTLGRRGPGGFPLHRGSVGAGASATRIWRWSEVLPWFQRHYALLPDEQPLSAGEVAHINAHLAKVMRDFDHEWQRSTHTPPVHAELGWHQRQQPSAVEVLVLREYAIGVSGRFETAIEGDQHGFVGVCR